MSLKIFDNYSIKSKTMANKMADTMPQVAPITTGQKARCAVADCQLKQLSLMRSLLKRCVICDARRPFGIVLKCLVCKQTFHRLCITKEVMCNRESADSSHAPAGVCVDGVREHFPANPDTTTAAVADVNNHEHVAENATEMLTGDATGAQVDDATESQAENAMEAHAENAIEAQTENATKAQATNDTVSPEQITSIESAPVIECSRVEKITCSICKVEFHHLCVAKEMMCDLEPADIPHASAGVFVDGVREHYPANPDTTTMVAADVKSREHVAEDAMKAQTENATETQATNNTGSPEQMSIKSAPLIKCSRDEKITWSEYYECLVNNTSEDEKSNLLGAIAHASRPSPMINARSSLTRKDYQELSVAWSGMSLIESSRYNKPYKMVVYSMTIRNTAHHGLKRVRFGRDPSIKSDR